MRFSLLSMIFISLALSGCSPKAANTPFPREVPFPNRPAPYPDLGAAPELTNEIWLNTAVPLRLANLRGKVALIDMWTFG